MHDDQQPDHLTPELQVPSLPPSQITSQISADMLVPESAPRESQLKQPQIVQAHYNSKDNLFSVLNTVWLTIQ